MKIHGAVSEALIGAFVNFGDSEGNRYQGTIIVAWIIANSRIEEDPGAVRITVACTDRTYRDAWLTNCQHGAIVKPKELQGGI